MKRTSALSGIIGIIFLLFGSLGYVLTAGGLARLFSGVNLLAGVIALSGWLVASRGSIGTMAGVGQVPAWKSLATRQASMPGMCL